MLQNTLLKKTSLVTYGQLLSTKKGQLELLQYSVFQEFDGNAVGNFCKVPEMSKRTDSYQKVILNIWISVRLHDLPHSLSRAEEGR